MTTTEQVKLKPCRRDAFWSLAQRGAPDECWLWIGAKNSRGYGNFRSRSAHVEAFELEVGPIPEGLTIDHLCSNRVCVKPSHLEPVTLRENIRRHTAKTTHCIRGHPLSGDNIRLARRPDGMRRRCRKCAAELHREAKRRKRHGQG